MLDFKLRPHQEDALRKIHNGCVLHGGVGTGKTITALAYAIREERGRKIVIITTAKVRDSLSWEREAAKLGIPLDNISIDSWNKIDDYINYEDCFFILDEQRLVGTGAWVKAFYKIAKKNRWILLSGTPGDDWGDYAPLFIANGWYKNITEFRREHAIYSRFTTYPKIERWVNEGRLLKFRDRLLVEMPMERHTVPHDIYILCDYDKELLDTVRKKRWNVYEDKPLMNAAELFGVMRKVVSSAPDRRQKMAELIKTTPRLIVFYNFNYELEILREICQEESLRIRSLGGTPEDQASMSPDFLKSLPPWELSDEEISQAWLAWKSTGTSSETTTQTHTGTAEETTDPWKDTVFEEGMEPTKDFKLNRAKYNFEAAQRKLNPTIEKDESWIATTSVHSLVTTAMSRTDLTPEQAEDLWETTTPRMPLSDSAPASTRATETRPSSTLTDASSTRSSSAGRQHETTASEDEQQSLQIPASIKAHRQRWMTESPTSETSSSDGKQLEQILMRAARSSGRRHSSPDTMTPSDGKKPPITEASADSSFAWAEWNGHKHQDIPDTERWVYLVQYASGSEGWNCIDTDSTAFWSLTYSYKQLTQAKGRIDRMNTTFVDLFYHFFVTDSPAENPVLKSLSQKKNFQPR